MGSGIRLTSIRGIDIKVHPSFLLALAWSIYHWGFKLQHGPLGAVFGLFLLVAAFVCVVGHELAHSFVALRFGLEVHDITLLPMGGVARIAHGPVSPQREVSIALAGPLLNLLLAVALTPFVLVALHLHTGDPLTRLTTLAEEIGPGSFLLHLWLANLLLAMFNLLPAFPMDGGRFFRASLTSVTNRLTATRLATLFGQCLAAGLFIAGIALHDLLLPLVAIFVLLAAWIESRMTRLEDALLKLPVGQFAVWDMGGVRPDDPLSFALRGGVRDVAVVDDGKVVGMLWRENVLARANSASLLRARDVMDVAVRAVPIDASVYEVHQWMIATGHPAIPVLESGNYRGIFTADRLSHVYRYLQDRPSSRLPYREVAEALGLIVR